MTPLNVYLNQERLEQLKRTEEHLRQIGCEKCSVCNYWVSKDYINKDNVCEKHWGY